MKVNPQLWTWNDSGIFIDPLETVEAGATAVWMARLPENRSHLLPLQSVLSAEERTRTQSFRSAADRDRFVVGRGLLRFFAGVHLNIPATTIAFSIGEYGKPRPRESIGIRSLHFNVSHSGDLVLLAFNANREVGIDVEQLRPESEWSEVAAGVITPELAARWAQLQPDERQKYFFSAWTRKEAGLKAQGIGLTGPQHPDQTGRLAWCDLNLPEGYAGALAVWDPPVKR